MDRIDSREDYCHSRDEDDDPAAVKTGVSAGLRRRPHSNPKNWQKLFFYRARSVEMNFVRHGYGR